MNSSKLYKNVIRVNKLSNLMKNYSEIMFLTMILLKAITFILEMHQIKSNFII